MFFNYLLIALLSQANYFGNCISANNNCSYYKDSYDAIYNTSIQLYTECNNQLNFYMDQYDAEMQGTDMCMEKLHQCETSFENINSSLSYTKEVNFLKKIVDLESSILFEQKKYLKCEEKNNAAYSLIEDYKMEISSLKSNISNFLLELQKINSDLNQCNENLKFQLNDSNKLFTNLENCIEREEVNQDQKHKYVFKLSECRKNKSKLQKKCSNK